MFDASDAFGFLCQIEDGADPAIFIAPIVELTFDRRHPIARAVTIIDAAARKRSSSTKHSKSSAVRNPSSS